MFRPAKSPSCNLKDRRLGIFARRPVRSGELKGPRFCYPAALGALFVELIFQCGPVKMIIKAESIRNPLGQVYRMTVR